MRGLVKSDGGLRNVYNLIGEAGVEPVLNANGEPGENGKLETTLTESEIFFCLFFFIFLLQWTYSGHQFPGFV